MFFTTLRFPRRLSSPCAKTGFTLVELLMVISVVAILSAILFGVATAVESAKKKTRAQADLAVLRQALESYKATHGDYPWTDDGDAGNSDAHANSLMKALLGWNRFERVGGVVQVDEVQSADVGPSGPEAFIDLTTLRVGETDGSGEYDLEVQLPDATERPTDGLHILDPWGNPYVYVYGKQGAGNTWEYFGYHLYSLGSDGEQDSSLIDPATGIMDEDAKFNDSNIDNLYSGE